MYGLTRLTARLRQSPMRDIVSPIVGIRSPLRGYVPGQGSIWFGVGINLLWGVNAPLRWGSDYVR